MLHFIPLYECSILLNKSSTLGCWISPPFVVVVFITDRAVMNKCLPICFVVPPLKMYSIFLQSWNWTFWIVWPNRNISKCDVSRGLKSVPVLGLAPFVVGEILRPPHEEAWASLLQDRPHKDRTQSFQQRPKHVNKAISLDHSALAELTQTWRTTQSTTEQRKNVYYFNPQFGEVCYAEKASWYKHPLDNDYFLEQFPRIRLSGSKNVYSYTYWLISPKSLLSIYKPPAI